MAYDNFKIKKYSNFRMTSDAIYGIEQNFADLMRRLLTNRNFCSAVTVSNCKARICDVMLCEFMFVMCITYQN